MNVTMRRALGITTHEYDGTFAIVQNGQIIGYGQNHAEINRVLAARFGPPKQNPHRDDGIILHHGPTGTAYKVAPWNGGWALLAAPINVDGSIERDGDDYNWCDVDFSRGLDHGQIVECRRIEKALIAVQPCEHVCAPLDPQCIKCGADLSAFFEKKYNAFGGYEMVRRGDCDGTQDWNELAAREEREADAKRTTGEGVQS